MSKILITGANGGFGALTVHTLLKEGHQVVANMRNTHQPAAEELTNAGAHVVELDVTNDASVEAGVA